jgi:hypothetical protein
MRIALDEFDQQSPEFRYQLQVLVGFSLGLELGRYQTSVTPDAQPPLVEYIQQAGDVLWQSPRGPEDSFRAEESTRQFAELLASEAQIYAQGELPREAFEQVAISFLCHFPFCPRP